MELPIKSNKTFLLEWWNVFWNLFSDSIKESFIKNNPQNFSEDILSKVSLGDLFNQTYVENIISNYSQILKPNMLNTTDTEVFMPSGLNLSNMNYEIWKNSSENLFQNQGYINENLYNKPNSSDTDSVSSKSNEFNNNNINYPNSNNMSKKYERSNLSKDFLSKIRRRSIKNNKIVFVHPHKALKQNNPTNNETTPINTNVVINNVTNEIPHNTIVGINNHQDIIKIEPGNSQKDDNMTIYSFNEKESINQSNNKGTSHLI